MLTQLLCLCSIPVVTCGSGFNTYNAALLKNTTQSSVMTIYTQLHSGLGVDGGDTEWAQVIHNCSTTKEETNSSWKVTFDAEKPIYAINITTSYEYPLGDFVVEFTSCLNGGCDYIPCYQTNKTVPPGETIQIQCDPTGGTTGGTYAKKIRIRLLGSLKRRLSVCEVEVYSTEAMAHNIALNQATHQSSVQDTTFSRAGWLAVDGNDNQNESYCSATRNTSDPWWQVDLESEKKIELLAIHGHALENVTVYVGVDCWPDQVCYNVCGERTEMGDHFYLTCGANTTARYVKIALKKDGILTLCDVQVMVYNDPTTTAQTTTTTSSTDNVTYAATTTDTDTTDNTWTTPSYNETTSPPTTNTSYNATFASETTSASNNATTIYETTTQSNNATTTNEITTPSSNATTTHEITTEKNNATTTHVTTTQGNNATTTRETTTQGNNATTTLETTTQGNNTTTVNETTPRSKNDETTPKNNETDSAATTTTTSSSTATNSADNSHNDSSTESSNNSSPLTTSETTTTTTATTTTTTTTTETNTDPKPPTPSENQTTTTVHGDYVTSPSYSLSDNTASVPHGDPSTADVPAWTTYPTTVPTNTAHITDPTSIYDPIISPTPTSAEPKTDMILKTEPSTLISDQTIQPSSQGLQATSGSDLAFFYSTIQPVESVDMLSEGFTTQINSIIVLCSCYCKAPNETNRVISTVDLRNLAVDKRNVSKFRRRFYSVLDERPSAISIGSTGIFCLAFVFCLFVLSDVDYVVRNKNKIAQGNM
ncbi:serine-rich adhesin for platelets-like [Haliotis rubra]|uniref:serine-rich adhesin for platelets-like n=1 Tax=Haliotis rubra TaxID=36100 RepID=UPI001EE5E11B|nr:serine-rich adhesin for platelets-like [Haliotis rubra]